MSENAAEESFAPQTLDLFRELIRKESGIFITPQKDYLLVNKLARLVKKSGVSSLENLYRQIQNGDHQALENLLNAMTTNHTFFFREKNHLSILRKDIQIKGLRRPLIWVAASSTGEEVYSIIIELLEGGVTDFLIVASDINREVLVKMKRGVYPVQRFGEVNEGLIQKYFTRDPEGKTGYYQVKDFLKSYVMAKQLNLLDRFRFEAPFDYIFCRNVLIYFDKPTQKRVIDNLLRNLSDLGYLFIGHSESLMNVTDRVESVFTSVYNKKL